ncbi:unnamed protein product, partial [Ilex paraguariensis]
MEELQHILCQVDKVKMAVVQRIQSLKTSSANSNKQEEYSPKNFKELEENKGEMIKAMSFNDWTFLESEDQCTSSVKNEEKMICKNESHFSLLLRMIQ